jgi:soluble lytic murein transglycosylase-like protein
MMSLILYIALVTKPVTIPIEVPPNNSSYWEDLVPFFEDGLEQEYGERARKYAPWILEASTHHNVSPTLLAKLIQRESSFRDTVVSRSGAIGPAQIKPRFWKEFCSAHDITTPQGNVYCSAQILSYLERRCGNMTCALDYYRRGNRANIKTHTYIAFISG